jgi:hypothetical protein
LPEEKNVENLLNKVSKYLGKNPEEIKNAAKNGNIKSVLSNLSSKDAKNIEKIVTDKNLAEKLLSTKEAQKLVKDVFGGK